MKYLIALFTIVALASCGTKVIEKQNTGSTSTGTETSTSATNTGLNEELNSLTGTMSTGSTDENKVTKLNTKFKTPGGEVTMDVNYSLDSEGKISSISIDSNYSHQGFNEKAEAELVGKTLDEASNLYIAWASLASKAFREMIKNA